ncbi:MAG: glycosyltransferase family 39 protein [Acidimicrobiia bacterium]|nr:glycosyltransferase family 39 protein [Acidimicrobiia bacterium]
MTRARSARWFWWALIAVAALGFVIRLTYILVSRQDIDFGGDARFYHLGANVLADGKGFVSPFFPGHAVQAGEHPPLYLVYLAIASWFGFTSVLSHLVWSAVLGTGTVVIVGMAGRQIGGPRVGIVAALLAASYPNIWIPDGSLMAESMAIFATAAAILFAYRYWRQPRWWRLALVGVASGAGALSRSELILIVPLMVIPLALLVPGEKRRDRWVAIGAGAMAAVVVMAPWLVFNLTRFEKPELLSTQFGPLLSSANCDRIWKSNHTSYFSIECTKDIEARSIRPGMDQSEQDVVYRRAALDYIGNHLGDLPAVTAARLGAIVGIYHPGLQIRIDGIIEGRGVGMARVAWYSFWGLGALAIAGGFELRRRSVPVFPLLVPPVMVVATVALTYFSTRFRASAEVAICLLAAVAVDPAFARWWRPANRSDSTPGAPE